MATYAIGDQVVCLVRDAAIVSATSASYEFRHIFDILSFYDEGYMVYVPISIVLKDSVHIVDGNVYKFRMSKKFIGSDAYYITDYKVVELYKKMDGMVCFECEEFYPMATANQSDGTLICWNCRNYKYWRSSP